jgi:hypothetical protein
MPSLSMIFRKHLDRFAHDGNQRDWKTYRFRRRHQSIKQISQLIMRKT